jgi:site-specific DNA-methyltransferase (adenine-specific)
MEKKFKIDLYGQEIELIQRENGKFVKPKLLANLEGAYTYQPKPAVEVVIVTMKPLSEKTYVEQALKNGKGITWLDDCRIPTDPIADSVQDRTMMQSADGFEKGWGMKPQGEIQVLDMVKGRFPANILVSDDALNDGSVKTSPSGEVKRQPRGGQVFTGNSCGFKSENLTDSGFGDTGSNSRYFSLDAWWQKKVKELPESVQRVFPFLIVPKASTSERNDGLGNMEEQKITKISNNRRCRICGHQQVSGSPCKCENPDWEIITTERTASNIHPTAKPVQLMSYLITLGSRQGDIVLDPFIGSGTTAISARILSRKFIGFERDEQYFKIAEGRIKEHLLQKKLFEVV